MDVTCTTVIQTIDPDTNGSHGEGLYETWNVNTVAPGNYRIRVQTLDDDSFADSGVFSVSNCQNIEVTKPTTSSICDIGSNLKVSWQTIGVGPLLKVLLYNQSKTVMICPLSSGIAINTLNPEVLIPNSVSPGNYVVRVSTLDDSVFGDSEIFEISNPRTINILNPTSASKFCTGSTYNITIQNNNFYNQLI